ncbi:MAG: P-II family nitrogen regulator [candidate division KSB1 bacterium]|nr:P-II family nitrogen regulator [candidate division KSB1 bacterium]
MKEIKAYIRCEKAEEVIHELEQAGVKDITLIDVMAIGENIDMQHARYSFECVEKYQKVAKLELLCGEDEVDRLVDILQRSAYTGMRGDGIICVSDVGRIVKIQTGQEDMAALA